MLRKSEPYRCSRADSYCISLLLILCARKRAPRSDIATLVGARFGANQRVSAETIGLVRCLPELAFNEFMQDTRNECLVGNPFSKRAFL